MRVIKGSLIALLVGMSVSSLSYADEGKEGLNAVPQIYDQV